MEESWRQGKLLSMADRGRYLLVEMPHGLFIDLRPFIHALRGVGVTIILAHAERQPELLHDEGLIEQLIGESRQRAAQTENYLFRRETVPAIDPISFRGMSLFNHAQALEREILSNEQARN